MKSRFRGFIATISIILAVGLTQGYDIASTTNDNGNLLTKLVNIVGENQKLTEHALNLSDRFQNLDVKLSKYAADTKKIAYFFAQDRMKIERSSQDVSVMDRKRNDWIVIQRRQDGTENFYRPWDDYKKGFGNRQSEFFIGLEQLHQMTTRKPHELLILMEDWDNERRYAKYDIFTIGGESEKYALKELGDYSGTAGDSLSYHLGMKFSTKDQENDLNDKEHCAVWYTGAWWYNACHRSNLNGRYLNADMRPEEYAQGIHWNTFRGLGYSLKFVEMMIRPISNSNDYKNNYNFE